ncbi:unnamed protein product [Linum trigynum]|uniref:SHSP domain-containing protein n=1 Tax=Linum trigynum TaxID=586398 RepID=A0AAV2GN43_9ROSI
MVTNLSSSQLSTRDERVFEDLEPSITRTEYRRHVCFSFFLPGFEREHIEVQRTSLNELIITAESPLGYDHRWIRFKRHIELEEFYDVAHYSAGFGICNLNVRVPRITPLVVAEEDDPTVKEFSDQQPLPTTAAGLHDSLLSTATTNLSSYEAKTKPPPINVVSTTRESSRCHSSRWRVMYYRRRNQRGRLNKPRRLPSRRW